MPSVKVYQARLAAGQCPTCGGVPDQGSKCCAVCKAKRATEVKKSRDRRRVNALCVSCGDPATPGFSRCEGCREKGRAKEKSLLDSRRAAGLCPQCGDPPADGLKLCAKCNAVRAANVKESRRRRIEKGLCPKCGDPPTAGFFYCLPCKAKMEGNQRKHYIAKRARGICRACQEPALPGFAYCEVHRKRVRQRRQATKQKVFDYYGGKCACCGETERGFLTIDHVNNDGANQRKTLPSDRLPAWLVRNGFPEGYQILCWNCNCGRANNGGVCPHHKPVTS